MKLNLGCGNDYKEGYINVDFDPEYCTNGIDVIADIRKLPFEANSVDEICAEGCLEHLSYRDVPTALVHWFSLLKPHGILIIETPNLPRIINDVLQEGSNINGHAYETLFGGQRNRTEFHHGLWTAFHLIQFMEVAGFKDISLEAPTKNLESGNDWNIRLIGNKYYDWDYPGLSKEKDDNEI